MRYLRNRHYGFSLIELISILVLLGVVSVFVAARFNATPFQSASFEQELRSAVRFAQKFAIVSGCDVQVDIDASSNAYALRLRNDVTTPVSCLGAGGAFATPLNRPAGGAFTGTAPGSIGITGGLTFFYDGRGRPSSDGDITLTDGTTITVEPVTGYVH